MNNERRNKLKIIMKTLSSIVNDIEKVKSEEEDYMDNMPENLQSSMRAEESEEAIDTLGEAMENINSVVDALSEIC